MKLIIAGVVTLLLGGAMLFALPNRVEKPSAALTDTGTTIIDNTNAVPEREPASVDTTTTPAPPEGVTEAEPPLTDISPAPDSIPEPPPSPEPPLTTDDTSSAVGVASRPHPISIPALMQKKYDGRDFKVGRVLAENEKYTRYYISYKSENLTISGVMNVPKGKGPFPVLILNHGYIAPSVYTNGRGLKREQDYLARRGYVVIHPDYRGHAQSSSDGSKEFTLRLGYVIDVINAVQAVRGSALPYFQKDQIGMLGHSMGGGIGLNILVAQPKLVKAIVLFAPVSGDLRDNYQKWHKTRPEEAKLIEQKYGPPDSNPHFYDNLSPNKFLKNVSIPVMVHHGTGDDSVPHAWSENLVRLLKQEKKNVTFHSYPGQPHEFTTAWGQVMERTVKFFDQHVK